MSNFLYLYLIAINLISFIAFYIDKQKAITNGFRIAESILILLSAIGGFIGSLTAIFFIRHKNKKLRFLLKLFLVLTVEAIVILFKLNIIK